MAYDFGVGTPDPTLFPLERWRRLIAAELRTLPASAARYGDPAGTPELRAAIARHVAVSRSVRCQADEVLVTRGAQQAFDLAARILIGPGTRVAVEEPGYPPARRLFESAGADVVGVPVHPDGIAVDAIPGGTRIVYVTPSHQFPLGTVMSLSVRTSLLEWADANDAVVIEDDYDSEFRFEDRPLAPLQQLDRSGRVVYVGSFSKTLLPSLRLGFLVAPASVQPYLRDAKFLADGSTDAVVQHALARFIDEGGLARHVRRARRAYAKRHQRITETLAGPLSPWLVGLPSVAGIHVCAEQRPHVAVDVAAAAQRARRHGVVVDLLADYYFMDRRVASSGFLLGYGGIAVDRVPAGLEILADCLAHSVAATGGS